MFRLSRKVLLIVAVYFVGFALLLKSNGIARTYPTTHTNLAWGFVHGLYAVPTLFHSLHDRTAYFYQKPHVRNWYVAGHLIGIGVFYRVVLPLRRNHN